MHEELRVEKDSQFNYIKNRKQYLEFYKVQKKIRSTNFLVLCRKDTESSLFSIGITVTKKIGNAVTRNKIKRRLKAYMRQELITNISGQMINIISIKDASNIPWREFVNELDYLFKKIEAACK
ncbi:MAG: ribonuclease P protein component [Candidatus Cloacimonadales bacterium]